jgi:hypothetical protein
MKARPPGDAAFFAQPIGLTPACAIERLRMAAAGHLLSEARTPVCFREALRPASKITTAPSEGGRVVIAAPSRSPSLLNDHV